MLKAAIAVITTLMLGMIGAAADATPPRQPDWPPGTRLALTFDHRESLKAGSLVRDDSRSRHPGRIIAQDGGRLRVVKGVVRRGVDFPNRCPSCGRAIIQVSGAKSLDPKGKAFVFGAAMRLTFAQGVRESNLVQKGFFHQAGGQYKLQLLAGGKPSCVVNGGQGRLIASSARTIANNRWHRLSCTRTADRIVLRVDGTIRATARGTTGWVSNAAPIRIGGKKAGPGNEQFPGRMDSVYVRIFP